MKRILASAAFVLLLALAMPPPSGATGAAILTAPTFTHFTAPALPGADDAVEPTLGFGAQAGRVLYQSGDETYRVLLSPATTPTAATWTTATGPAAPLVETVLHTDLVTGRTWRAGIVGACTAHAWSDDGGATWSPGGTACVGTTSPSLSTGPARSLAAGFPRALYSCAQGLAVQCARSDDGGLTFGPPTPVTCGGSSSGAGDVHAAADGAVYVPFLSCGGRVGVAFSQDGGHTWTSRSVLLAPQASVGFAPDAATTRSGHLYLAYPTAANRVGVARSLDHGASWTVFGDVAAPAGIQGSAFHQAVAGDDGRVAVAFLGTTATGNPFASSFNGVWLLHASVTFDGGTTWTTASTGPNVIQRGWICAAGTACGSGRNLFESMDAALDARGLVHVALADGCVGVCDGPSGTKAQSTSTWATLVVQTGGTDLIAP